MMEMIKTYARNDNSAGGWDVGYTPLSSFSTYYVRRSMAGAWYVWGKLWDGSRVRVVNGDYINEQQAVKALENFMYRLLAISSAVE